MLLAAAAFALLGCGGSGSSNAPLSKAEFIKLANHLCKVANEERYADKEAKAKELGLKPGELRTPKQGEEIMLTSIIPYERSTEKLKELIPSDQKKNLESLIKTREEVAETLRATVRSPVPNPGPLKKANLLAAQYNLPECAV